MSPDVAIALTELANGRHGVIAGVQGAARQRVAAWLARGPWSVALQRRFARAHTASPACGCDGCPTPGHEQPVCSIVRLHRRGR